MKAAVNGIDVSWFEVGRGEPVVLIHGLGDDHRAWRRVVDPLMLRHRVILYDLRGHGGSALGTAEGTLEQLGDDLIALCDALELDAVTLAGFSLGGTIAMRVALDAPGRVSALALVGTSSRVGRAATAWYAERAEMVDRADPSFPSVFAADVDDVYRNRPGEAIDGLLIRRQATADPRGYANACRAMAALGGNPLDDELEEIVCPTVVLAGEDDQHCPPKAAEIIAGRIAGSELTVLGDTGHPLPVERPVEVAEAIVGIASRASEV